ncbi:MAG: DUF1571 domain-containing protein [Chitinophagales bacterium]|nr:DUF1571 domain-containing protein [Chitinophagales bacterium]
MKKLFFTLTLIAGCVSMTFAQDVNDITKKVLDACGKANHITYDFYSAERFEGNKIVNAEVKIKFQGSPMKVYADASKPQKAILVYIPSENSKVHVKKGLKIWLALDSKLIMKEQHHTLDNAGFATFKRIIEQSIKDKGMTVNSPKLTDFVIYKGETTYDGHRCWMVDIIDNDYKIVSYKVPSAMTIWALGKKLSVPEYTVQQINNLKSNDLTAGQVLKVPSSYAKKTTVYINQSNYLPIYQKMYDNDGVFEEYQFKNVKTNVKFTNADFDL